MNKKITILMIALGVYCQLFAQSEVKTLFNSSGSVSPFLSTDLGMTSLGNDRGRFLGIEGGVVSENGLITGIYRRASLEVLNEQISIQYDESTVYSNYQTEFDHLGISLGYARNHKDVFNFAAIVKAGTGSFERKRETTFLDGADVLTEQGFVKREVSRPIVITPTLKANLNITRWMKISGGVGYQITHGISSQVFSDRDFSGISYEGSIILGWFN